MSPDFLFLGGGAAVRGCGRDRLEVFARWLPVFFAVLLCTDGNPCYRITPSSCSLVC